MKLRKIVLPVMLLALLFTSVAAATTDEPAPLFPTVDELKCDIDKYPIQNYTWDANGLLASFQSSYQIANWFFTSAAFLVRIAILILQFGSHSELFGGLLSFIVTLIGESRAHLLPRLWPFITIGMIIFLTLDYARDNLQGMGKRVLTFFTILGVLSLIYNTTSDGLKSFSNSVNTASDTAATLVISMAAPLQGEEDTEFNSDSYLRTDNNVNNIVWKVFVENPWQMGMFGTIDQKIGSDDFEAVQNAIQSDPNHPQVTENTRWADVVLNYSSGSKERKNLVDILNNKDHRTSSGAFDPSYRLLIATGVLISSCAMILFFLAIGIVLIIIALLFYWNLVLSTVTVPASLILFSQAPRVVRNVVSTILAQIVALILVKGYVGVVFLVIIGLNKLTIIGGENPDRDKWGFVITLIVAAAIFVLAIFFAWNRYKNLKPLQVMKDRIKSGLTSSGEVQRNSRKEMRKNRLEQSSDGTARGTAPVIQADRRGRGWAKRRKTSTSRPTSRVRKNGGTFKKTPVATLTSKAASISSKRKNRNAATPGQQSQAVGKQPRADRTVRLRKTKTNTSRSLPTKKTAPVSQNSRQVEADRRGKQPQTKFSPPPIKSSGQRSGPAPSITRGNKGKQAKVAVTQSGQEPIRPSKNADRIDESARKTFSKMSPDQMQELIEETRQSTDNSAHEHPNQISSSSASQQQSQSSPTTGRPKLRRGKKQSSTSAAPRGQNDRTSK